MAGPFNMPDEYVQGFFKAGQSLVQSFAGGHSDGSAGAVAPAGTALAQLQAAYWQGQMALWLLLVTSTLGSYLGALTLYGLGRRLGHDHAVTLLARLPLVDRHDFERSSAWFRRHGRRSVFGGRLVPGVRSLVSLPAGAEHMPLLRFSIFTIAGSALWNAILIGLGWLLGSRYDLVDEYSGWLNWVVVAAVVVVLVWLVVRRVRHGSPASATTTSPRATGHEHQSRSGLMPEQLPD